LQTEIYRFFVNNAFYTAMTIE